MQKLLFILGELSDDDIDWMIQTSCREEVETGAVLIREGSPLDKLYVLLDGTVKVSVDQQILATLHPGEIFGEMSFLDSRSPSATVTAAEPCVVLSLLRNDLSDRLQRDIHFSASFYRSLAMFLSDRLRAADSLLGYGNSYSYEQTLDEITSPEVLSNYHLAKTRYDWFLNRLRGMTQDFSMDIPANF
ncbi:MAG: cyclic nucleotide-binding domain-containing protein [Prochlorotrichaceae cyanobacterium]|jgi:CRP-like cAMP-binding protein